MLVGAFLIAGSYSYHFNAVRVTQKLAQQGYIYCGKADNKLVELSIETCGQTQGYEAWVHKALVVLSRNARRESCASRLNTYIIVQSMTLCLKGTQDNSIIL